MNTIEFNIVPDLEYGYLTVLIKDSKLTINTGFSIEADFNLDTFINGDTPLVDNSGEINGSNWSIVKISDTFVFKLESNCGGAPYVTI